MPESARTSTFLTVGLLDSPAEEAFDRLTRLASRVLSVPLAAVTLSDGNHQFWKSVAGIPDSMIAQRELPVEGNCFCRWVGDTGEQLVIPDTSLHPLGSNNPTADELSLHSFLGVPLPGPEGSCLGCFAVADTVPRSWTADDVETLAELAVSVSTEIQLRHTAQTAAAERERYARLLNDVDAIVWEAEADTWRFTFVSGRAEALLGYPVARWLHEPGFWSSLLHPDDRERAVRYCTEWTAAGEDHEFEYRAITASGRTVWLRDLVRVIPAEDGRPAQLRGVMLDITCQKEAELALIERELRFRSLIENSSDLITVLGRDATVLYQSPSIRRILGYEPEVLLAGRAVDFVHPDDLPAVRDLFGNRQAQLPSDPSVSFLYRFRARDGAWRWLESTATDLGEDPVIRGLVINSRDVTQRVEIEVAYRQSEERYRRIVETASEGVWITDLEGRTTFVNSQMARMLGYTPDEMVGREVQAFLPEEDYAALEARLLRRREGITEQFDLRCLRKDGSEVWLLVSATPLRSDEGSHLGSLSMVSDITERKRSEDALREERRISGTIHRIGQLLTGELDLQPLLQILTDEATVLAGAEFGAFFYTVPDEQEEGFEPFTISAAHPEQFTQFAMPRMTDLFGPTLRGEGVIRLQDVTQDPRYGHNPPHYGIPAGHPPVRSYLSVPVVSRSGDVLGALFFGHRESGMFTARQGSVLQGIAAQAAIALDNARLYQQARRAEEALREKVTILGAITNETPDAIYVKDRDGRYLMMNPAGARILGRPVDEVLGRSDFELFSPEAAAQVTASDQPVLLNGEHVSYVARLTTPVGPISALTVKVPYRDGDGRVIGVIGISRDISERAAAEEALKASEVRFRAIFDQAGIGISLVDAQGSVVQANAALQRMLGYSFEELAGRQLREFTYPEDAGIGWEYFQEMRAGLRDEYHVEKRYVRKDGRLVCGQLTVTAVRDAHGELQFAVGMVEDVTIRKRAEQRNAEFGVLGQRLNAASTPRQAAEIVLDAADRLLRWDCCWLELFAAGRKNATVMLSMDLVDGVRSDVTDLHAGQRISGLTLRAVERGGLLILRTPETMPAPAQPGHVFFGVPRPSASLMCVPIRTGDRFLGALSIQSYSFDAYTQEDVETLQALADYCTGAFERTQAESARRLLQEQLIQAQKMEAVGRLAGGVAHDFNNMLGVITGYCELLLDQPTLPETVRKPLGEVKKAGERAASLTRQLLAFSRKQMIQPQVLDLRAVVTSMDQMLHRLIGEDIQLITRLPRVLGSVMADPGQVEQVLMNLVLNARDAMPQGGTLTLELAEVTLDQPPSTPDGLTPGRYVCLTVADTGCGMDEETLPHLFEPFYTTKEVGKGTGLGLATVYGIVRQSDGYVAVDSAPGQGATFRIYLPRLEDPEPATVPTAAPGGAPRGSETILVAEDEEMLRRLVCTLLRAGGYQVLEAGSAEEALAQCSRHASPIHLLLTDVVMPGGSGRDLAVNALARHPGMKVIYMSGYTDDAVVRHGISSAEVHFLQKPFTAADLAQEVRRVLDGRGE